MKTIAHILAMCLFVFGLSAQHDHSEIEHLFENKSLADFEQQIGLTAADYSNTELLDFVDEEYQKFHDIMEEKFEQGLTIRPLKFELSYGRLVEIVKEQITSFKPPTGQSGSPKVADGPCVNMDFEMDNFTGWTLTRGNVTGAMPYSFAGEFATAPGPYHRIYGGGVDPVCGIPRVNPLGGAFSARLGNGTGVGARAARLKQTFLVDPTNYMFTYSYAVIFESPAGHSLNQLPYFTVRVFDSLGNSIPCGEYSVIADAANTPDYQTTIWNGSTVLYKNWESVFTNLSAYIGQNVTVEFTSGDCSLTGHFGYAYVDASCGIDQLTASNDIICVGDSSVLTAPAGASAYLWSNGATTQSTTVYAGGVYSCTVTPYQGGGCDITLDITISENPMPVADFTSAPAACVGAPVDFTDLSTIPNPGTITAYRWDFGDGVVTPLSSGAIVAVPNTTGTYTAPSHTYMAPGVYNVELYVESADGCGDSITIPVTINGLPAVVAGPDQTVCDGESVTLSGAGAVSYVWDNGVTDGVPFTPVLGTTTYTVTGTDANGCVNTDQVDVIVNPLPVVDAGADQTVCDGESVTLNGAGASVHVWDNGVMDGVPFVPAVGTTTYTVTGTDANGCVNTDQVDVLVNPLPAVDAGSDQTVCEGDMVTLTGTGIAGSGAGTYVWDNGITNGVPFMPAVGTTTYTVTGTDLNGCVNTDQVDVTVNAAPIVMANADQSTVCDGETVTLTGMGASSYTWDNGVTDGVPFVPGVGTTTYTVTGTDGNGCTNTDQIDITVNALPVVVAGADQTVCEGTAVTLSGSGASVYVWDNGVMDGVPFVPAVGTTTYTVTGTDVNGCVNTDQVDVLVNPLPAVDAGSDQTVCEGDMVTLTGTGIAGSGAGTYVWDNGITNGVPFMPAVGTTTYTVTGTDLNGCVNTDQVDVTVNAAPIVVANADQSTVCDGETVTLTGMGASSYTWDNGVTDGVPFVPGVGATTYTVTGTDGNGCTNTDQIDITVNALPVVVSGADQTVCEGTAVTLSGSGASVHVWDNGITDGVPFVPGVGTTTYTVTGTDANGCVNTDQVDVLVNPLPTVDAGSDQTVCEGDMVTLTGTGIAGSGAGTYVWDNGITNGVPFMPAVGTTTYTVTGTDLNGCVNTDQVDVTVNAAPIVVANADQSTVCDGETVTLTGMGASSYTWDNGVTDGVPFVPGVGTTTYTVTGTDGNGCTNTDQIDITVNALPVVVAGADQTVCEGTAVTLSGSGASVYVWDNGITDGISFVQAVGTVTYTVVGTDANGCSASDQVDVTVHPLPTVDAGADQTVCDGEMVTLIGAGITGAGAGTYVWDNGITNGVPFMPAIGTTTYTVTGTDANGCVNTDQVDITVHTLPVVNAGVDQAVCEGESVTLSGSGAPILAWDNGVTNGVPFVQAVGTVTYTLTGTDANGCMNTDQVVVVVNPLPSINAGTDRQVCEGTWVTLSAVGSPALYWNNGVTNNVPFIQVPGVENYIVHDSLSTGCTASDTVIVEVFANPIVTAEDVEICEGDGAILEGQGAVSYIWTGGIIDGVEFYPTETSTYMVTGTDANGCIGYADATVRVNYAPNVDFKVLTLSLSSTNPITGFDNLTTGAVSYQWNFGDGSPYNYEFEPVHTFPLDESGEYAITLTAESEFGCEAQAVKYVHVFPDYTIFVPNTFTPDGNGANEIFKPVMQGFDEDEYTMYIFNRWGDLIFETHNMEVGWDGTFAGQNFQVQDGVYTWKIIAGLKDSADSKIFVGHVTILK